MVVTAVRLLPTPDQHALLRNTLQRVNRACNAARAAALDSGVATPTDLRPIVKAEIERFKLPATFVTPSVTRVHDSLRRQKFTENQSFTFARASVRWPGTDRVTLPTSSGRRTIPVWVDPAGGTGLRPPLAGRDVTLVFRNGDFELVAA